MEWAWDQRHCAAKGESKVDTSERKLALTETSAVRNETCRYRNMLVLLERIAVEMVVLVTVVAIAAALRDLNSSSSYH